MPAGLPLHRRVCRARWCRPRWPHRGGAALPLSPRVPGSLPRTPGCRASDSPLPPAAFSVTAGSAGGRVARIPWSPQRHWPPTGRLASCCRYVYTFAIPPPGPFPSLFAGSSAAGPRGARGRPCPGRVWQAQPSLQHTPTNRAREDLPPAKGGREWPRLPSGEGAKGAGAGSEVQAWGSWTRARREASNPHLSSHSPFQRCGGRRAPFIAALGCPRSTARAGALVRREEVRGRAEHPKFPRICGLGSQC